MFTLGETLTARLFVFLSHPTSPPPLSPFPPITGTCCEILPAGLSDWPYLCIKTNTLETQCKQWPPRSRQLLWSSDLCRELWVRLLGRPIYPACFSFTRSCSLRSSQKGNKLYKSPLVRKKQSAHKSDRGWHVFSPTRLKGGEKQPNFSADRLLCRIKTTSFTL